MRVSILMVAMLAVVSPAAAQTSAGLGTAIASGQVGERYDGYRGVAGTVTPEVRRQVSAVNIQRRSLYTQLAGQRRVNAQVVGLATGCQLIAKLAAGRSYMTGDGAWHRLAAGQRPPSPDYCR
jgi:uncharacterized protein YdbL (DUF1318 family)